MTHDKWIMTNDGIASLYLFEENLMTEYLNYSFVIFLGLSP